MNDYQQRQKEKAAAFEALLAPIAAAMGWHVVPVRDDNECAPTWRTLANGTREIWAQIDHKNRLNFQAIGWPSYTDEAGNKQRCFPTRSDEWTPKTTAAANRDPKAIAKQIESKLIPDYETMYESLAEQAASHQKYANRTADALKRLAEATGNEHEPGKQWRGFYVRDLPGETVRIDWNSVGDCRISLDTDEMIAVIGLLRTLRTKAAA